MNKLFNHFLKKSLLRSIKRVQKSDVVWDEIYEIFYGLSSYAYFTIFEPNGYFVKNSYGDIMLVVDESFEIDKFISDIGHVVDGKEITVHVIPNIPVNTLPEKLLVFKDVDDLYNAHSMLLSHGFTSQKDINKFNILYREGYGVFQIEFLMLLRKEHGTEDDLYKRVKTALTVLTLDELIMYVKINYLDESLKSIWDETVRFENLNTLKEIITEVE